MQNKSFISIPFCLILIALFSSCVSQKQIAYFQKGINQSDTLDVAKAYIPRIQSGDILAISIGSLNPAASSFFNPYSGVSVTTENTGSVESMPSAMPSASPEYLVDASGSVELPLVGNIKLSNLSTIEAKEIIRDNLKRYLKEPSVNIRYVNYKISIMGEVVKPSIYIIRNEKITLPEALSMAGDLTIFGKRENILVIRDLDGKKEFGRVNLSNRDVYNSPYYYLHNNDIIYVEPSHSRVAQTDRLVQFVPILLSALSLIVILIKR